MERYTKMKCLNCGRETEQYVCAECQKEDIWSNVLWAVYFYDEEKCENEHIKAYMNTFEDIETAKGSILEILRSLSKEDQEYYYCKYAKYANSEDFEQVTVNYLNSHKEWNVRKQLILKLLLGWYGIDDLITPEKWYEVIERTIGLYADIYYMAADYRAKVGDYDLSEKLLKKVLKMCNDGTCNEFFGDRDKLKSSVEKTKGLLERYRSGKPYWPVTEERRKMIMQIYDKKGISYDAKPPAPRKVKESDFQMPTEYVGNALSDYCAFWCSECFSVVSSQDIYEIAAVKIRKNKKVDVFCSYIKPWKTGETAKKSAAKEAGLTLEELNAQKSVHVVMKEFFDFVGTDVLVSTDAMGKQLSLLTRAARYSKYTSIPNKLLDILYYAEDNCDKYRKISLNRQMLLSDLKMVEGKNALEKATINYKLYQKIKNT